MNICIQHVIFATFSPFLLQNLHRWKQCEAVLFAVSSKETHSIVIDAVRNEKVSSLLTVIVVVILWHVAISTNFKSQVH